MDSKSIVLMNTRFASYLPQHTLSFRNDTLFESILHACFICQLSVAIQNEFQGGAGAPQK